MLLFSLFFFLGGGGGGEVIVRSSIVRCEGRYKSSSPNLVMLINFRKMQGVPSQSCYRILYVESFDFSVTSPQVSLTTLFQGLQSACGKAISLVCRANYIILFRIFSPFLELHKYFDLPDLWRALNQRTRLLPPQM